MEILASILSALVTAIVSRLFSKKEEIDIEVKQSGGKRKGRQNVRIRIKR